MGFALIVYWRNNGSCDGRVVHIYDACNRHVDGHAEDDVCNKR